MLMRELIISDAHRNVVFGDFNVKEPIIAEYLRLFYKMNEIYSHSDFDNRIDLLDEISYYNSKESYSDEEIIKVEQKCIDEWKSLLIKICNDLLKKIQSNKDYIKLLKIESKEVKSILIDLNHDDKKLYEYEELFDKKLVLLKDKVEVKIDETNLDKKLFRKGLIYGGIIGFGIALIAGIILSRFGYA